MKKNYEHQFNYVETDAVKEFVDTMKENFTDKEMICDGILFLGFIILGYFVLILFA